MTTQTRMRLDKSWLVPVLGLAWNTFGIVQFASVSFASAGELARGGMTIAQAELYAGLPLWMTGAFALGVFGGLVGCGLLLMRRSLAVPVLGASLSGYVVLYGGDYSEGVFAAFGTGQIVTLTIVLAIAIGLFWYARRLQRLEQLS